MPSYYFVKLYDDILDDHKMGHLPDHLWRRVVELFLLANRERNKGHRDEGFLPTVSEMAWTLRCSPEQIEQEMQELHDLTNSEQRPIVQKVDGRWFVTRFAHRQEPVSDKERKRRQRDRDRVESQSSHGSNHKDSHASVTTCDTDIELDLDLELELDKEGADAPPPKPAPKRRKASKTKDPPPPAIDSYRSATHLYPEKSLWPGIVKAVGDDQADLARFEKVCMAWVAMGWNKKNVKGMLQHYNENRIPGDDGPAKGKKHGTNQQKRINIQGHTPTDATPEEFYGSKTWGDIIQESETGANQ